MNVKGRRVLIFGDSLSNRGATVVEVRESSNRKGSPGDLLASMLLEAGASAARLDAKVSRSAHNFFKLEPASAMIAADRLWLGNNGIVIVMLGTNDLGLSASANKLAMTRLRDAFAGHEIWSVGPPSFARSDLMSKTDAIVNIEREVFGENRFIDSRPITTDLTQAGVTRTSDGVHFAVSGAKAWATRIAQALLGKSDRSSVTSVATTKIDTGASEKPDNPILVGFGIGTLVAISLIALIKIRQRRNR